MPINDRIDFKTFPRAGGKVQVKAHLYCDTCDRKFEREGIADKEKVWDLKEQFSNEIAQHHH